MEREAIVLNMGVEVGGKCLCYSPRSGGSRDGPVIVSHYPPWRSSMLIETLRLRPLTHHTPSSPCSRETVTTPCQWIILSDLSEIRTNSCRHCQLLGRDDNHWPMRAGDCVYVCVCVYRKEIKKVIDKLKCSKAVVMDGITAEIFKYWEETVVEWMCLICDHAWR